MRFFKQLAIYHLKRERGACLLFVWGNEATYEREGVKEMPVYVFPGYWPVQQLSGKRGGCSFEKGSEATGVRERVREMPIHSFTSN